MAVHTHWHRLRDAAASGSLCLATDAKAAVRIEELPDGGFDATAFSDMLDGIGAAPRLVISPGLPELTVTNHAMLSLADMHHCGVLSLPYPETVVEYDAGNTRYSIHLSAAPEASVAEGLGWQAIAVASYDDDGQEVAMAFPGIIELGLTVPALGEDGQPEGTPSFRYKVALSPFSGDDELMLAHTRETADLVFRRCVIGFLCGMLLPNTLGLVRERLSSRVRNKARIAKGRHPVPDHTLLRLGSYVDRAGETNAVADGSSPEVHLRRGHKRRVAVGEGRTGRVWRFIRPQVVGYLPDGTKPTMAEMLATRAAKPYLVKG